MLMKTRRLIKGARPINSRAPYQGLPASRTGNGRTGGPNVALGLAAVNPVGKWSQHSGYPRTIPTRRARRMREEGPSRPLPGIGQKPFQSGAHNQAFLLRADI